MKIKTVNLKEKFDSFTDYWSPKIIGELNGQLVKESNVSCDGRKFINGIR